MLVDWDTLIYDKLRWKNGHLKVEILDAYFCLQYVKIYRDSNTICNRNTNISDVVQLLVTDKL